MRPPALTPWEGRVRRESVLFLVCLLLSLLLLFYINNTILAT